MKSDLSDTEISGYVFITIKTYEFINISKNILPGNF